MKTGLGTEMGFLYRAPVIVILRLIGVMNAVVWFGASVFFTFGAAPALFSEEMKDVLGRTPVGELYMGLVAQTVLKRYYAMHYWCGGLALAHLLAEWVYLGKSIHRWTLAVVLSAFVTMLVGGVWLQPKMRQLHLVRYSATATVVQKDQARRSFRFWHGMAQVINLLVLGGVGVYVWRVAHSSDAPRFVSSTKFRS